MPVLAEGVEPANVHVVGFKYVTTQISSEARKLHIFRYSYDDFAPTFTVGSFFWHLVLLSSQVSTIPMQILQNLETSERDVLTL